MRQWQDGSAARDRFWRGRWHWHGCGRWHECGRDHGHGRGLSHIQRTLCIWMLVLVVTAAAGAWYMTHTPNGYPGIIRLHIIANSDLPEDQAVKLAVRDAVLQWMDGQEDLEDARRYIDAHLPEIEERAEAVIRQAGYDYPARAVRRVTFIPEKQYEDLTLPAGNYEALQITLGRGDGRNWWCVIFPQLCLVGDGDEADSQSIVLKSKIKELLRAQVSGSGLGLDAAQEAAVTERVEQAAEAAQPQ